MGDSERRRYHINANDVEVGVSPMMDVDGDVRGSISCVC